MREIKEIRVTTYPNKAKEHNIYSIQSITTLPSIEPTNYNKTLG